MKRVLALLIVLGAVGAMNVAFGQYQLMKVPASGAAWVDPENPPPPPQSQSPPATKDDVDALRSEIRKLRELIEDALKEEGSEKSEKPERQRDDAEVSKALTGALTTCLQCHNERDAPKKGDRFVLFNQVKDPETGKTVNALKDNFTDRDLRSILREVERGTMPKKGKLTQDQQAALIEEVKARRSRLNDK